MTKFNQQGPFTEVVGGSSSQEQWDSIFGKRKKMRCPTDCSTQFCQRKDFVSWQMGGDPEEWLCKRCGAPAEYHYEEVARVMGEAIRDRLQGSEEELEWEKAKKRVFKELGESDDHE